MTLQISKPHLTLQGCREIRAFIFDMDGTLLHTMPDLAVAANEALAHMGFPTRSLEEMLAHMGHGGRWLIEQIVPESATPEQRQQTFELWRELYIGSDYALTTPFKGVVDTLQALHKQGVKLGILSNKLDAGVRALAQRHFEGLFDAVQGDTPPLPRKPDPASLLQMLETLNVLPEEAVYVGDSQVDVQTARNAGVRTIGVSWGYDQAAPLLPDELDGYIHTPHELLDFVQDACQAASRAKLCEDIAAFEPFNEQEAVDKQIILRTLYSNPNCFDRSEQAHMACSIWVVDPSMTQTLLVHHNIYDSWSWIGGHADGECDLQAVALRELQEETGVQNASIVPCGSGAIYSIDVLTVNGHEKNGEYVSSHLHLNVTYLAIASPDEPTRVKPDENSGVRWAPIEDAIRLSTEPWIRTRVYRKLIDKLRLIQANAK